MSDRYLVVGLGNPEREYGGTRHNLGADALRVLTARLGLRLVRHKVGGKLAEGRITPGGSPVTLFLPSGYMNNVGGPVQRALAFYKVPLDRLVVVHDDLDLAPWIVRLKRGGGTGGHNGLEDIVRRCGGSDFLRVRIGIGRPPERQHPSHYVLGRVPASERVLASEACERAADAVTDLIERGLEPAQNLYHAR